MLEFSLNSLVELNAMTIPQVVCVFYAVGAMRRVLHVIYRTNQIASSEPYDKCVGMAVFLPLDACSYTLGLAGILVECFHLGHLDG